MPTQNYLLLDQKKRMIENLREKGISDENVLNAFDKMERHLFMESLLWPRAYEDTAIKLTTDGASLSNSGLVCLKRAICRSMV